MPSKKRPFKKISIIGLGLIGSSIALAIKKKKLAEITSGYSRSLKTRTIAKKLKLTSEIKNNISECVKNSDCPTDCCSFGFCTTNICTNGQKLEWDNCEDSSECQSRNCVIGNSTFPVDAVTLNL